MLKCPENFGVLFKSKAKSEGFVTIGLLAPHGTAVGKLCRSFMSRLKPDQPHVSRTWKGSCPGANRGVGGHTGICHRHGGQTRSLEMGWNGNYLSKVRDPKDSLEIVRSNQKHCYMQHPWHACTSFECSWDDSLQRPFLLIPQPSSNILQNVSYKGRWLPPLEAKRPDQRGSVVLTVQNLSQESPKGADS